MRDDLELRDLVIEVRADVRAIKDALPDHEARLRSLEASRSEARGRRGLAEKWRLTLLSALSAVSGYAGGVLARWPGGHH